MRSVMALYVGSALAAAIPSAAFTQPSCDPTWTFAPMPTPIGANISDSVLLPNGDIVVVGDFQEIGGVAANRIARWDGSAWHAMGAGLNGLPREIVPHPAGGFVVCGAFTQADGVSAEHIARWDGSWSALGAGLATETANITIGAGGVVYASGLSNAPSLARWDGAAWTTIPVTLQGGSLIDIVVLPNGNLVVGGYFTSINSVVARNCAVWNGSAWLPMNLGDSSGAVGMLASDAVGTVYAAMESGPFGTSGVFRWNGSSWTGLSSPGGLVSAMYDMKFLPDGRLIVSFAADLSSIFPPPAFPVTSRTSVRNATSWSSIAVDSSGQRRSLEVLPNGNVIEVGRFGVLNGLPIERAGRWDGTTWQPFTSRGNSPNNTVHALAVLTDGRIMAGGVFSGLGDVRSERVGIWNGSAWTAIPGLGGYAPSPVDVNPNRPVVRTLCTEASGTVLAGGQKFDNVLRWNGSGWTPLAAPWMLGFYNTGTGFLDPGDIHAIALLEDGTIAAGGRFNPNGQGGGSPVFNNIARHTGTEWAAMGQGLTGSPQPAVYAFTTLENGDLLAGGSFTQSGAVPMVNLARWDGAAWSQFGGGVTGSSVRSLTWLSNGDVVAAGLFTSAGGVPAANIARWNGSVWSPLGSGTDGQVNAVAVLPSGDLLVGGAFGDAGGVQVNGLARWNGAAWAAVGSGVTAAAPAVASVNAIVVRPGNEVLIGGSFTHAGGVLTPYFTSFALFGGCQCDLLDFNGDGVFPDTEDINDFISVFAGGVCSGQFPADPPCNTDIDFNNDGLLPDVADIESLLSVFAGGACL